MNISICSLICLKMQKCRSNGGKEEDKKEKVLEMSIEELIYLCVLITV